MVIIILICLGSLGATSRHCQLVHCVFRRGSLARGSPNRVLFMICMNIMRTRQLIACITTPDIDAREQNHRERVLNGAVPARVRSSSTACVNKHTCTHTRTQRPSNTGKFLSCMAPKGTVSCGGGSRLATTTAHLDARKVQVDHGPGERGTAHL